MYIGLWLLEGFPVSLIAAGILTHVCYASLLSTFPIISLLSPGFIGGTGIYTCNYSIPYSGLFSRSVYFAKFCEMKISVKIAPAKSLH